MIDSLTKLTMSQFVDLLCGDVSVLSPGSASDAEVKAMRMRLIFDFTRLSDPSTAAKFINRQVRNVKRKASLFLFEICHNLIEIHAYDEVRAILSRYGVRSASMDAEQLEAEVGGLISRTERDIAVEDKEEEDRAEKKADEIRQSYDRQCAMLMTYFRFQIDMGTIKASQFACMLDQAAREVKARKSAMARK